MDEQQAAASVGQIYLINNYKKAFNKKKVEISQVLLTLDDTIKNEKKINATRYIHPLFPISCSLLTVTAIPGTRTNNAYAIYNGP